MEVGIGAIGLDILAGDCARRQLLDEINKIILGLLGVLDELGRDGGKERELLGAVERGDLLIILGNEGIVPSLEVLLQSFGIWCYSSRGEQSTESMQGGAVPRRYAADHDNNGMANRAYTQCLTVFVLLWMSGGHATDEEEVLGLEGGDGRLPRQWES